MDYENRNDQNNNNSTGTSGGVFSGTPYADGNKNSYMDGNKNSYADNRYPNDYTGSDTTDYSTGYSGGYHEDRSYIPQEPKKKDKKKKSPFFKKAVAVILLGIFFGVSAGVSLYAVNKATGMDSVVTDDTTKEESTTESSTQSVKDKSQASTKTSTGNSGIETTDTGSVSAVVTDVTQVVDEVMPSVVSITNTFTSTQNFFGQDFSSESEASGSGIIVNETDEELLVVTNNHVVESADTLKVQFIDGEIAEAKIKGTDSNMDLAVIAVKLSDLKDSTKQAISIAKLGDSASLKVGEPAIAIGNALGYGQSVTTGVISALDRQIEMSEDGSTTGKLIQTDAAINPGNSGGALLNVKGEVIGINSNKIGGSSVEGMGYAIPISSAEPIIQELMSKETKDKVSTEKKGYLGISGINVTSDVAEMYGMPEGVYVNQVYSGTGAENAGIEKGDIITGFDGSTVSSMEDLQGYLEYYEAGASVSITVQRQSAGGYEEKAVTIVLSGQSQMQQEQPTTE